MALSPAQPRYCRLDAGAEAKRGKGYGSQVSGNPGERAGWECGLVQGFKAQHDALKVDPK